MSVSRTGFFIGSEGGTDVRLSTLKEKKKPVVLNLNWEYHDTFHLYKKQTFAACVH